MKTVKTAPKFTVVVGGELRVFPSFGQASQFVGSLKGGTLRRVPGTSVWVYGPRGGSVKATISRV